MQAHQLNHALELAEDQADEGNLSQAIASLIELRDKVTDRHEANLVLVLSSLLARNDQLAKALKELQCVPALTDDVAICLEGEVIKSSIHAALGEYDTAIPMLEKAVKKLKELPHLSALYVDARTELRGYHNLVSPKNAATWASLLNNS